MDRIPEITVLMPVYNAEKYLKESIESILNQTFGDFEFLIINDGSCDSSVEIIESFDDSRIKLVHNPENLRIAKTLNRGLELAQGKYIARMDADDISHPERLQKQLNLMEKYPQTGICSTWYKEFGLREKNVKLLYLPQTVKVGLAFTNPVAHPSVMINKDLFNKYNLKYKAEYVPAEDLLLWTEAAAHFPIMNIPEYLLFYRVAESNQDKEYISKQKQLSSKIAREYLNSFNIVDLTDEEKDLLAESAYFNKIPCSDDELSKIIKIYYKIWQKVAENNPEDMYIFTETLTGRLAFLLKRCENLTHSTREFFQKTPFYNALKDEEFKNKLKI